MSSSFLVKMIRSKPEDHQGGQPSDDLSACAPSSPNPIHSRSLRLRRTSHHHTPAKVSNRLTEESPNRKVRSPNPRQDKDHRRDRSDRAESSLQLQQPSFLPLQRVKRPSGHHYDATSVRVWPSRDPIGENGGINLYGMVVNDAVGKWDFLGLYRKCGESKFCIENECRTCSFVESDDLGFSSHDNYPNWIQDDRINESPGVGIPAPPEIIVLSWWNPFTWFGDDDDAAVGGDIGDRIKDGLDAAVIKKQLGF